MSRSSVARLALFLALTVFTLALDLASKAIVFRDLGYPGGAPFAFSRGVHQTFAAPPNRDGESVPYLNGWITFRLFTSFNPGALWGIGRQFTWAFTALSLLAVAAIPVWLFFFHGARSRWLTCALGLICGGTLGNLYDRLGWPGCADLNGVPIKAVRDFLLFTFGAFHWPVFNLADVSLVTGAVMLVLHSLFAAQSEAPESSSASAALALDSKNATHDGTARSSPSVSATP